ncbi:MULTISPECIES: hypothetical protein [unclassified Streptomyces]|uniref:hypothetical protein n=1 Tax=unclassified Streptomyces TaxID=2593676 RepID=UPI00278C1115|nr:MULTISPECIES: hypothetical protein [unclassified Streptomyces]
MKHLSTRAKVVIAATLAASAAVGATAAVASTPGPARAPHSQVAALVEADGSLSQNKGVANVDNPSLGAYCLTFTDPRVDPQKVVPQATIGATGDGTDNTTPTPNGSTLMIRTDPHSWCGDDPDTITVITTDGHGRYANIPFYFSIA